MAAREKPPGGFRRCSRCGRLKALTKFRKRRLPPYGRLDPSACVTCNGYTREYVAWQKRAHPLMREAILVGKIARPNRCTDCRKATSRSASLARLPLPADDPLAVPKLPSLRRMT